jgi:hypothetical protein
MGYCKYGENLEPLSLPFNLVLFPVSFFIFFQKNTKTISIIKQEYGTDQDEIFPLFFIKGVFGLRNHYIQIEMVHHESIP